MKNNIITNEEYDKLGEQIEDYIEEHLGENMNASQVNDILQIICSVLGVQKE